MIELQLPWPGPKLSPNARIHWASLADHKKKYRSACWLTCLEQLRGMKFDLPDGPLHLEMEFVPPQRRSYDRDNLVARMKAGIDGLADALKIDDKRFSVLSARLNAGEIGGFVRVRISKETSQ